MAGLVVVTGATGQVGRPLVRRLSDEGRSIIVLTRRPAEAAQLVPEAEAYLLFDPAEPGTWAHAVDGADAVIVLGGAPFFRKWSSREEFDRVATGGRVLANQAIVKAIEQARQRPGVLVTASAVGYYGFTDSDDAVTEDTPQGNDRWATGTASYEHEALRAAELGVRTVCVRTGIVLSPDQGMAAQMAPQFRHGFGAIVLPGSQWLPWIHIDDEVELFDLALRDQRIQGPLNASAPNPARYRDYAHAMGHVLHRPVWLRLPGAVMRLALGDVVDSVLHNRRMLPRKALDLGHQFRFPDLEPALRHLLGPHESGTTR